MKTHQSHGQAMKKRAITALLTPLFTAVIIASCTSELSIEPQPVTTLLKERVDLAIEGAINTTIHEIEENGLVGISQNLSTTNQAIEQVIRIKIDESNALELTVYNMNSGSALSEVQYYSSYPYAELSDKPSYVRIKYVNSEGAPYYASSMDGLDPLIQPNVFEIRDVYENGFNARIRDLTLFPIVDDHRSSTITINGTFIAKVE